MTLEQNGNVFWVFSDFINDFVAEFPAPTFTLVLEVGSNCTTPTSVTIGVDDIQSEVRTVDGLLTTVYYYELTLPAGPTSLRLIRTNADSSTQFEFICAINLSNDFECQVIEVFKGGNNEAWLLYSALDAARVCDECVCDGLCAIYTRLTEIVDGSTTC